MAIYFRDSGWMAVRQCAEADGVAAIPLGSLEQHGPHLPCGTDTFEINEVMARAMARIDPKLPICVCPTVEYSLVQWASPLASAGIEPFTLLRILLDICHALTDLGFSKIILVYGQGGSSMGQMALWQAMQEKRPALYVDLSPYERCALKMVEVMGAHGNHAGVMETSMMLAIRPDLVNLAKAVNCPPDLWGEDWPFPAATGAGVYTIPTIERTPCGVVGSDPRWTSAEKGHALLDVLANCVAEVFSELASAPIPEEFRHLWRKPLPNWEEDR